MTDNWRLKPLGTAIIEIANTKGPMTFEEIIREIRKESGFEDVTNSELLSSLMSLEVEGLIRVTTYAKGSKRVEVIPKKVDE